MVRMSRRMVVFAKLYGQALTPCRKHGSKSGGCTALSSGHSGLLLPTRVSVTVFRATPSCRYDTHFLCQKGQKSGLVRTVDFSFGVHARSSGVEDDATGNRKENTSACVCTYVRDDGQTSSEGIRSTAEPIRSLRQHRSQELPYCPSHTIA